MHGFSTANIALGSVVAVAIGGAGLVAERIGQPDADLCCAVVSVDAKARTVTAKVTKTGQTFTLSDIPAGAISNFKAGATLDLACAVPPNSGTTGASGNAASSGTPPTTTVPRLPWVTSTSCGTPGSGPTGGSAGGTNVPRDSNTKSTQPQARQRPGPDCVATTGAGVRTTVPCPDGVQVRSGK